MSRRKGSSFSSASTAEQVTEGIDGTALTAIVTGDHFFFLKKNKIIVFLLFNESMLQFSLPRVMKIIFIYLLL